MLRENTPGDLFIASHRHWIKLALVNTLWHIYECSSNMSEISLLILI